MKKVITTVTALVLAVGMFTSGGAYAANVAGIGEVVLSTQKVYVNGEQAYMTAYNINGNNFFKLRDIGAAIDIGVDYNSENQSIIVETAKSYVPEDGAAGCVSEPDPNPSIVPTSQKVYVDGVQVFFTAYNINGNNYFKLRDVGLALNIGVDYDYVAQAVMIDTTKAYTPEKVSIVNGTGSGQFSSTPIQAKYLDGSDGYSVDYSLNANPTIFTDALTRGAYNAIYQTMLDKDQIIPGNNEKHINPYYDYSYSISADDNSVLPVLSMLSESYRYEVAAESVVKEIYKYPSYFICKVYRSSLYDESVRLTASQCEEWSRLATDREKIAAVVEYVTARINYRSGTRGVTLVDLFKSSSSSPVDGVCSLYAGAVQFLCEQVGIVCITVSSVDHAWNEVYFNGQWLTVDATAIDLGWTDAFLVSTYPRHTNSDPAETAFAKELLVPKSTIK